MEEISFRLVWKKLLLTTTWELKRGPMYTFNHMIYLTIVGIKGPEMDIGSEDIKLSEDK